MVRDGGRAGRNGERQPTGTKPEHKDNVDALFRLPLVEFTGARNALAGRLKKAGSKNEADRVKALVKPSVSAWAVNQLYWQYRDDFDQLIATGKRFRQAQKSGKVADINGIIDARRESLTHLTDLATSLLQDAGHNPSQDTMRRVGNTLEALSVYGSFPGGEPSGCLTHDVDPPGFDSLASLMSGVGMPKLTVVPPRPTPSHKSSAATDNPRKPATDDLRRLKDARKSEIAAARVSLEEAKRGLGKAQAREQRAKAAQTKANSEAQKAEKDRRAAEQGFQKARFASEDAGRRARSAASEVVEATKAVADARRAVETESKELAELIRELRGS